MVFGYREYPKTDIVPEFKKVINGRSKAIRLAVKLKSSQNYNKIMVVNHEGEMALDLNEE